ncbi:hypothetical protein EDB87DRAFT_145757 [Lactarius vividus]|nr:hypothetical protein EDB87DRAFT_145757 [Lactarius vividus]
MMGITSSLYAARRCAGSFKSYKLIDILRNSNTMSIVRPGTPAPNEVSNETLAPHFDFPGSDVILRSCDAHSFRVLKLYIANVSPILRELFTSVSNPSDTAHDGEELLPVVKLPEGGDVIFSLLTFIFPPTPILPSTTEKIMELLSVAQKYQMDLVLAHIRGAISLRDPPFIRPETAFYNYFLAQKHELHQEALQAARVTLRLSLTIEGLEDKLEFMPGAYLHELWKYRERVRTDLKSSLLEFRNSGLPDDVKSLRCVDSRPSSYPFPRWLDEYIESLAETLHLFDLIEFENIRVRHIKDEFRRSTCPCADISSQVIRTFWEALTAVVYGTIEKANLTLALVREEPTSENSDPPFGPLCLNLPDASLIVRSSDQVDFRVHKSLLAVSSPFFEDLLSLPQPPDGEHIDGLPVIQLSEDAGLLNSPHLVALPHFPCHTQLI